MRSWRGEGVTRLWRSRPTTWAILLLISLALTNALRLAHLPAALMLGPMVAAIWVADMRPGLKLPRWLTALAQAILGCLIARSMTPPVLLELVPHWPALLGMNLLLTMLIMLLGFVAARLRWLPGTSAIWGMSPGGASAMVLLSEAYGGDKRLVALMQYLRVVAAALVVVLIGILLGQPHAGGATIVPGGPATPWLTLGPPPAVLGTAALAGIATLAALLLKRQTLVIFVSVFGGIALQMAGWLRLEVPPLSVAAAFTIIGWHIGLSFTRAALLESARLLPRIALSILAILALSAALALLFARIMRIDFLTAYLALNPGGTDAVLVVAESVAVDLPLIMAMQISRIILVVLLAPLFGRWAAAWHMTAAGRRDDRQDREAEALAEDADTIG
ncbi:hypothetical protein FHS96_004815 [Sphingomonas zeicaulis]|uniref:AbrB family transcriptional regulator n=1 Tax=Sphingomonas zeicaulis TaxID=1632740 RepID=UPI003D1ABB5D